MIRAPSPASLLAASIAILLLAGCARQADEPKPPAPAGSISPTATLTSVQGTISVTATEGTKPLKPLPVPAEDNEALPDPKTDGVKIASFLGNKERRYYGQGVPKKLELLWRVHIGSGKTSGKGGSVTWSGTGWTGQATVVRDKGKPYVLIGGYDHGLRKIDARSGKVVWRYGFDDVIKGTNTVFENAAAKGDKDRYIVVGGSRRGFPMSQGDSRIAPVRAVSFATGKELWRFPVVRTACYSQDADSSGLYWKGRYYEAVESGYLYKLDPAKTEAWNGKRMPKILKRSRLLYDQRDASRHGGNLVVEASPMLLDGVIYVSSGAGHVYGLRERDLKVVWDFYTGTDLDGTTVANDQGKILAAIEKQYTDGHGGVYMLDPKKTPKKAVVWYFPTENRGIAEWLGGVVGSVAINDSYNPGGAKPSLAAFNSVDGNLYVVSQDTIDGRVLDHAGNKKVPTPALVFKDFIGGAISTPIIVDDHIIAAGYDAKVHLYRIVAKPAAEEDAKGVTLEARDGSKWAVSVKEVDTFSGGGSFESTPIVWDGRVYIGSRDGFFYCLGEK